MSTVQPLPVARPLLRKRERTRALTETISVLNDALNHDRKAITSVFLSRRVSCNQALAEHPIIQVSPKNTVGALGVLNGVLSALTGRKVVAVVHTPKKGRPRILRFQVFEETPKEFPSIPLKLSKQDIRRSRMNVKGVITLGQLMSTPKRKVRKQ